MVVKTTTTKTVNETDIPMDFNDATGEVTVNLPEYTGVLFVLDTNETDKDAAVQHVWDIYGDSIEEALIGYNIKLL